MVEGYLHLGKPFPTDEMGTVRCLSNRVPLEGTLIVATMVDLEPGDHYAERFWRVVGEVLDEQGLVKDPTPDLGDSDEGGDGR